MPLPIPLAQIAKTEAALGTTLPALYKAHMARANGGEVAVDGEAWWLLPLRDETSPESLRRSAEDVCRETQRAIAADLEFPEDGIAIAHNGSGDLLLLRRTGTYVDKAVWCYRLHGGDVERVLDDVAALWDA